MSKTERIYWTAWAAGTALIVMSWMDIVSNQTGWIGFYIAGAATLISLFGNRHPAPADSRVVMLSRAMLESKNHAYDDAMQRFREGGSLVCEGLVITLRGSLVYCSMVVSRPLTQLDEMHALEDERAQAEFEVVSQMSPELAGVVQERKLVIQLITSFSDDGFAICDVSDGKVEWKVSGTAYA